MTDSPWATVVLDGKPLPGSWSVRLDRRPKGGPVIGLHGDLWTTEQFAAWMAIAGRLDAGAHEISHPLLSMSGIGRVVMLPSPQRTAAPVDGICRVTLRCAKAEA